MMVCCPTSRVTNSTTPQIKPRYPQANGEPRPVEDRTPKHCRRWKNNGACRLDKDFSGEEYDTLSVYSVEMFPFMMSTCMKTCGWGERVMSVNIENMWISGQNVILGLCWWACQLSSMGALGSLHHRKLTRLYGPHLQRELRSLRVSFSFQQWNPGKIEASFSNSRRAKRPIILGFGFKNITF